LIRIEYKLLDLQCSGFQTSEKDDPTVETYRNVRGKIVAAAIERRKQPRIDVRWPVIVMSDLGAIRGETRDISSEGVAIFCDEPLRLDASYHMAVTPPEHEALDITGRVTWSDLYGMEDGVTAVGMGICFMELSGEDRGFLNQIVSAHLSQ
jgi:hypothetical protein